MKQKPPQPHAADNLSDFPGTVVELNNFLEQNPSLFPVMVQEMLQNPEAMVRLRMGNAVAKAARKNPEILKPFQTELLNLAPAIQDTEIIWHLALLLGYLELENDDLALAINLLFNWFETIPHKIVKVNCLQTLAVLSQKNAWLQPEITELLQAATSHESPAIRARSRILLKKIAAPKKW